MRTVPHRVAETPDAVPAEAPRPDGESVPGGVSGAAGPAALAAAFEAERPHLRGVAYRLLGSFADAEDAVQEAWLRLGRVDADRISDLRAWLTVVVSRLCLDQLRSARGRREGYVGPWLPEPFVAGLAGGDGAGGGADAGSPVLDAAFVAGAAVPVGPDPASGGRAPDPADRVTLAESVSMAMMVVLETLSPAERTAFILHDVFGYDFTEIAAATGRTPAAARQLASRARRHVRDRSVRFDPDPASRRRVAEAFFAAAAGGELDGLLSLLDPDAVLRSDGGGLAQAARRPVVGADRVARFVLGILAKAARRADGRVRIQPIEVNGEPGFANFEGDVLRYIAGLHVAGGRIVEINIMANPEKMRHLPAAAPSKAAAPPGVPALPGRTVGPGDGAGAGSVDPA
ncbi:RNA polymerase sigma factor, sigma-70 family [Frankia torreyi]|uniref:RNA polymerase sigma factor, sigma-70 family n=1 Tax=Frankia torreyi TaxID=1856 RepID=A0A0D8B8X5_9ACTN|nr:MULTISPECIES: sigma-70 family RNA polymerase sigma factor [Frankia]KJE20708.1 RNA polymerase sigma factor, sigma-70 family [Frankia torreyi]KQM03007.1 RNA polymerase sigma factor, sigma-70 family [Frankia sp. CpI1-P]